MTTRPPLPGGEMFQPPVPEQSMFQTLALGPSANEYQAATTDLAAGGETEGSLLTENLVGAFAQRCDRLMVLMQAGMAAPGLMRPETTLEAYYEGLRSEAWLVYWNRQRTLVR